MSESTKAIDVSKKFPPMQQKLEFYTLGKERIDKSLQFSVSNPSFAVLDFFKKDSANNIYDRNYLRHNIACENENQFQTSNKIFFKNIAPLRESNDYLNPFGIMNKVEK